MTGALAGLDLLDQLSTLLKAKTSLDVRTGPTVSDTDFTSGTPFVCIGWDPSTTNSGGNAVDAQIDWAGVGTWSRTETGTVFVTISARSRDTDAQWILAAARDALEQVLGVVVNNRGLATHAGWITAPGSSVRVNFGHYDVDGSTAIGVDITTDITYKVRIPQGAPDATYAS